MEALDLRMWCFTAGVTGVLPTEIFNQTARPAAYMIAGSMMWLNLFITGMIFPFLVVSVLRGSVLNKHTRQTNYKFSVLGNKNNLVIHHCKEVESSRETQKQCKHGQTCCSSRLIFMLPLFSRAGSVHSALCLSRWSACCLLCTSACFCPRRRESRCRQSAGNSTSSTTKARMGNVDPKLRLSISWVKHLRPQLFRHHRQ